MGNSIGEKICYYRQLKKLTQEELASRIGVTPQAVSKWERESGLPDVNVLAGIASVLDVSADDLLGIEAPIAEKSEILANDIKTCLAAEPLLLEFGVGVIPIVIEGLKADYVSDKRRELALKTGMILPMLRFRDNTELDENAYQISIYGKKMASGICEQSGFNEMIDAVILCCKDNYADVLNKQLVKIMVDNLKEQFPGVADDLIPGKVSYLQLERKLQEKLRKGESIKDMIHILEELEEQ